jgi:hypothetical protein
MFGMGGYRDDYDHHAHYKEVAATPYEKCHKLFVDLHYEYKKSPLNIDCITNLKWQLLQYPTRTQSAAFDAVVDSCGWPHGENK